MPATREYHSIAEACTDLRQSAGSAVLPLFQQPDWFGLLHRHCLADRQPAIFRAQEDGADAWIFLTASPDGRASALANWYSFDWRPIFIGAPDTATRHRLLDAICRDLLARFRSIDLHPLQDSSDLLASLRRVGWFAVERAMGGRYLLDLGGRDFAAWWADRPGRLRSLVKRKRRKERYGIEIHDRLTDDLWRDYVLVDARSWKGAEEGIEFLRALAARESAAGRLRIGFARDREQAVAAQLWSIDGDTALIHKLGHDAAHDGGSPGTLLSHAMFAQAIDQDGVAHVDYGTGDNGYKADWMERRVPLLQVDAFNPRRPSAWLPAARTAISALVG